MMYTQVNVIFRNSNMLEEGKDDMIRMNTRDLKKIKIIIAPTTFLSLKLSTLAG